MRTSLTALALTLAVAACAHAQESPPAGGTAPGAISGTRVLNPRPAASIGFSMDLRSGDRPVVSSVKDGSPAAEAGIAVGDTVVAIDGNDTLEHRASFRGATPGRRYTVRVKRGDEEKELVLVAGPPPAPQARP